MTVETKTVEVIIPDEDKALKIKQKGKVLMYMLEPYYKLPHYDYEVEEVDKKEAIAWIKKTSITTRMLFRGNRR